MPYQVIDDPNRQSLGGTFATGINTVLQGLAQHKINEIQQNKQARQYQQFGFTPEESRSLVGMDPTIQKEIVKQKLQAPQQEAFARAIMGESGPAQPGQPVPRLTGDQALKLAQFRETQQNNIRAESAPFLKSLETEVAPQKELKEDVKEALRLFNIKDDKGNRVAQIGALRGAIPSRLQNDVTQALAAKFNAIVTKKAQLGKGVPSKMRLLLEQASKPDIWMKPKAVEYLLNNLLKSSTDSELKEIAKDQVVSENGNMLPRGLENLVKARVHLLKKLPDPEEYSDDTTFAEGGLVWGKRNGQWAPIEKV